MRLVIAVVALFVALAPLIPSAVADGGETSSAQTTEKGCRIDTADPTKPAIYGDCIIWGSGTGVLDTMTSSHGGITADVTVVTPATVDCDALCNRMIELEITVRADEGTTSPSDAASMSIPLAAYVTANLEAPLAGAQAGNDEGGFYASTILTPFEQA